MEQIGSTTFKNGYKVVVCDKFYFGNFLPKNLNLKIVKGDIRNTQKIYKYCKGSEILFIYLHFK